MDGWIRSFFFLSQQSLDLALFSDQMACRLGFGDRVAECETARDFGVRQRRYHPRSLGILSIAPARYVLERMEDGEGIGRG